VTRSRLEIAANSLRSAVAAESGGADRIELCADLEAGGTTPSYGTIAVTRDHVKIPLHVLIRPRTGDFCYKEDEIDSMLRDIEACAKLGCNGVVIGALDGEGDVDEPLCRDLVVAAGTLAVTFHRAFDTARDQLRALDTIIALGCTHVLTSGGEATALIGAERIAGFVEYAGTRLHVIAGAGLTPANIREVARRSKAGEFHASASSIRRSLSRHRNERLPGLNPDWRQTDEELVRALKRGQQ
jgi:copper homeostasis protein